MSLESVLTNVPAENWAVQQVVVFDWFDGPRNGVALMRHPYCEFVFELLVEKRNPQDLDDRVFRVSELPKGSVANILDILQVLGKPANTVWVPVWTFSSADEQANTERKLDLVLAQRSPTTILILTRDMTHFLDSWDEKTGLRGFDVQDAV